MASSSKVQALEASKGEPQVLPVDQLPLPALSSLQQQLEQEMELLTNSLSSLKLVQQRFEESRECIAKLTPECEGNEMLVPLTSSMYVPGKLCNVQKIILDIGTGFYVEKTTAEAEAYFRRRVEKLTKQMESVQKALMEKNKLRQVVGDVLQAKVQGVIQAQQGQINRGKGQS